MRAITIHQPHAWAVIYGGKSPENRSTNFVGAYRGPIAIHAGLAPYEKDNLSSRTHRAAHGTETPSDVVFGGFIGVVDLVSVHHDSDHGPGYPCSAWALSDDWHLMLENPRPLPEPIPARGFLGLWTPTPDQITAIENGLL